MIGAFACGGRLIWLNRAKFEKRLPAPLGIEMKSTDIRRWTEDEDELLRAAIGKFGEQSEADALDREIINSSLN